MGCMSFWLTRNIDTVAINSLFRAFGLESHTWFVLNGNYVDPVGKLCEIPKTGRESQV